jgi:site-specific DNA-methyltransferase (adenine-specific)
MNTAVMFSKASDEWATPLSFLFPLYCEFGFTVDAAATAHNTVCAVWFGPDKVPGGYTYDALAIDWLKDYGPGPYWLNPPYSKCREFIAKAASEAKKGCTVVCLVPSRTDTRWWHAHVWDDQKHAPRPGVEIRFVKGRLKFGNTGKPENGAPFPSVVIIFRKPI